MVHKQEIGHCYMNVWHEMTLVLDTRTLICITHVFTLLLINYKACELAYVFIPPPSQHTLYCDEKILPKYNFKTIGVTLVGILDN